jgi:hypothetical protein
MHQKQPPPRVMTSLLAGFELALLFVALMCMESFAMANSKKLLNSVAFRKILGVMVARKLLCTGWRLESTIHLKPNSTFQPRLRSFCLCRKFRLEGMFRLEPGALELCKSLLQTALEYRIPPVTRRTEGYNCL